MDVPWKCERIPRISEPGIPGGTEKPNLGWEVSDSLEKMGKFQRKSHFNQVFLWDFDFIWLHNHSLDNSQINPKV